MDFNITTKYSIGDRVYVASHYYDMYAESEPYVVTDVFIHIDKHRTHITYELDQDGLTTRTSEDRLFSTFKECIQWCKAQNG